MINRYDRDELRERFRSARPFGHIVFDDFLEPAAAEQVAGSYPDFATALGMGVSFRGVSEHRKVQVTDSSRFAPPVRQLNEALASPRFLADLSYITGIPDLLADPQLSGGGMHLTGPGGRLDVHVDFNLHEQSQLHRRLNILLYLNPVWQEDWGGQIELWDPEVRHCGLRLAPRLNRCLVFETTPTSYHGVRPISAPPGVTRKSFAAYYYTQQPPAGWKGQKHSTVFRARPDEWLRGHLLMPAARLRQQMRAGWRWAKTELKRRVRSALP
jgi:hypothetical protein